MNSDAACSLEVVSLCKKFGQITALENVSFRVGAGEMFFLLGPSGCGKTTLLRILAGLEKADSGSVVINGKNVNDMPAHQRGLPMVFQNYALWPHLTVLENVAFGLKERGVPRSEMEKKAKEALTRVDLSGCENRKPGQLSGGQQQRVALARALVLDPAAVLLDEPLSNLDAKLRAEMREYLYGLHASTDITFIYVTHDQVEALSLADRMAVMTSGRIMAVGSPAELYHRPPNVFCAGFLGEANMFPVRVTGFDGKFVLAESPLGLWYATSAEGFIPSAGSDAVLMIRPENIRPSGKDHESENVFDGKIVSTRMHGATLTVSIACGDITLKATVLSDPLLSLSEGQSCRWSVHRSHAVVLAPGGEVKQ